MTYNITLVKDSLNGELYGAVIHNETETKSVGFSANAQEWAGWANDSSASYKDIKETLDYSLQQETPLKLNAKTLAHLRETLPDTAYWKVKRLVPETSVLQYGPKHKTMGTRYVSKRVLDRKTSLSGTYSKPLASFSPEQRAAAISFKTQFAITQERYANLNHQVKGSRAIFDANIGPGGGWRCPDGTLYGGQITDRFGRGCGGGLTRRIGRALLRAGQRLDDIGTARDTRRLARRAQAATNRRERRESLGNFFDAAGDKLEAWAQALVGDYLPGEGGRRRRRGLDAGKVTRVAKGKKKRVIPDKSPAAKKKGQRKKKGARARLADFSDRISAASERMARRLVGDYKPDKKDRKKKGSRRERAGEKLDRLAEALERTASRILGGGGRRERRKRDKTPVERKPSKKAPTAKKKPTPKPDAKKPSAKKPTKKVNPKEERKKQLKKEIADLDAELKALDDSINSMEAQGMDTGDLEAKYKRLQSKRDQNLAELVLLDSNDPASPAKLPKPKATGKPDGAPKKKLPGKQHGGVYTKAENAKAKANAKSVEEGKPMYVVVDSKGKFRVVDEDRLKADESLQVAFATDQEGGVIDIIDVDSPVEEIIDEVNKAAEAVDVAINEHLKDLDVDALDLELKRSKTGAFLPESFDKQTLDAYSSFADQKFRESFHEERMTNWRFWQNTLGDDKLEGIEDSKTLLALIDKTIKDESDKPDANQSVLGVMRAERANFLAMWVPNDGDEEVNFYERINFVQPKRRQNIIGEAGIGDLIVGKKKTSKKEKPKKVSPDAKIVPNAEKVPDPSDMGKAAPDPDIDPDDPPIKSVQSINQAFLDNDLATLKDSKEMLKAEAKESNFAEFRDKDGKIDLDKFDKDIKDETDAIVDEYLKLSARVESGEPTKQSELDELAQRNTAMKARKDLRNLLKIQRDDENFLAEKANNNTVDTEAITPDGVPDGPSNKDLYMQKLKDYSENPGTMEVAVSKASAIYIGAFSKEEYSDPEDVDSTIDSIIATLDFDIKAAEERLTLFNEGKLDAYSYDPFNYSLDDDIRLVLSQSAIRDRINAERDVLKKKLNNPTVEPDQATTKSAALTKMFDDGVASGFNKDKLETKLNAKLSAESLSSLNQQIDALTKTSIDLDDLPDDFDAMSIDDKVAFLKAKTGGTDDAKALGRLYQSVYFKKFGSESSRFQLNGWLDGHIERVQSGQLLDYKTIESSHNVARQSLADLIDFQAKNPPNNEIERIVMAGQLADVRNLVMQYDLGALSSTASPEVKALAFKSLNENIDELDEPLKTAFKAKFDTSFAIKPGSKPKTLKSMPNPENFDPAALGTTTEDGLAISRTVPVGSSGIFSPSDASVSVASGLPLSQIPDDFLADAIKSNIGDDKRFRMLKIQKGFNGDTTAVFDITTGKKYIIKTEDRNHLGHLQESAAASLAQELGFGVTGVRYGSPLKDVDLPGAQKSAEGVTTGLGRTMVLEHLENLHPSSYTDKIVTDFSGLPAGAELDGESIARLMVLDRAMNYFDRTPGNLFFVKQPNGKWAVHPIDHGNAFRPWGGSQSEQSVGFIKITKGDNVDLMGLAKKLDAEETQKFAKALVDAKKRYQKADFSASFKRIADSSPHSADEIARLEKHAAFLEQRKTDLDWDDMVKVGLGNLGFSGDDIEALTTLPPQYKLPERTKTIADLDSVIAKTREKSGTPFVRFAHDGDQVEFNEVRAAAITFKGAEGSALGNKAQKATQFTFRRRVADIDPSTDPSWTKLGNGHIVPNRTSAGNIVMNFGLANPHTAPGSDSNKATYYKELDNGSIVMVTVSSNKKNTADNMVRIIIPDKGKKTASSDQLIEAMQTVGISDSSAPDADKIAQTAKSNIFTTLTGGKLSAQADPEKALDDALAQWELTQDDIRLVPSPDGGYDIGFTPDAAKTLAEKIKQQNGITYLYHNHSSGSPKTFASGAMMSTLQRFDHGILKTGSSSATDMDQHGSGNWLYFYKGSGGTNYGGGYTSRMPLDVALMRGDFRAFSFDAWGDIDKYQPLSQGMQGSSNEVDFRSGVSFGRMVTTVPNAAARDEFIKAAKDAGNDTFGGVPVELLVVVAGDAAAIEKGFDAIREQVGLL